MLVGVNGTGKLIVRNAVAGVTHTSTTVVSNTTWHELEVHVLIGSAGRFDITLDGSPISTLSRPSNLGPNQISRLMIGDTGTGRRFDMAIDDVGAATDPGATDTQAPSQPTGLVATAASESQVDLGWGASTDDVGVAGYTVYRSLDGSSFSPVGSSSNTTYRDSPLAPDTTYWWMVEAFDAAGNRSLRSVPANATTDPSSPPVELGRWSAPFDVGVSAIHSVLLHTGEVLLFHGTIGLVGTVAKLYDPRTGDVTDVSLFRQHNMFCAGHSLLPNGDVLVTGGTLGATGPPNGTDQTSIFDPDTRTWREGPPMLRPRWYPTNISILGGGETLIFSGKQSVSTNTSEVETYIAASDTFSFLPATATLEMGLYPRLFALQDGRIVRVGRERQTLYLDPETATWTGGALMNFGARPDGSAVLLPGLTRVLTLGGHKNEVGSPSTEMIDLAEPTPVWRTMPPMAHGRQNLNAVVLPDGDVLVVGGNVRNNYDEPVKEAELFDPGTETWTTLATQAAPRGYHSTAVLLPDGRVFSAGQNYGSMQTTAEIFSPPYLFRGPRPVIAAMPSSVEYGESFSIETPDAGRVSRVALIRPDSVTHGVNFDQRYVSLPFARTAGTLSVAAPSAAQGPPGWYMLFLVDDDGVPSIASWMHLS